MHSSSFFDRSARRAYLPQSAVLPLVLTLLTALTGCAVDGADTTEAAVSTAAIATLKLTPQSPQVRVGGTDAIVATPSNMTSVLGWSVS